MARITASVYTSHVPLGRTFNCGLGMLLFVDPTQADALLVLLEAQGETAARVGNVEAGDPGPARVVIDGAERAWQPPASPS
jgi:phosphoribosylformylglycinamidine cyclo-ligase